MHIKCPRIHGLVKVYIVRLIHDKIKLLRKINNIIRKFNAACSNTTFCTVVMNGMPGVF